jgi:hypothetical protein|tara:strand:+ start:461 stop:877 length:417 start_codon:yes stop_codon:yes gene_type:complete
MADAVTSQTLSDGDRIAVVKFTNISDGTGESSVAKVDISALAASNTGLTPSRATIEQIWYDIGGMRVALEWNATSNVVAAVLGGSAAAGNVNGHMDFRSFGGLKNTEASGANGDIDLTTHGHTNHDHYTIVMQLRKSY